MTRHPAWKTILAAGGIAGILDITAACTLWGVARGVSPVRILQGIASGLLGPDSFNGGWRTAALGLGLHFFIATSAAAVFYAASRFILFLLRQPIASGALYGVAVHLFMSFVVIPLSAMKRGPQVPIMFAAQVVIHIVCVGTPIALVVRGLSGPNEARGE